MEVKYVIKLVIVCARTGQSFVQLLLLYARRQTYINFYLRYTISDITYYN